jgi:thioredoxin reductase (NADPH)
MTKAYNLAVVGAGPAGLACAIEAKKAGINVVLIDKGNVAESIINFPVEMTFFSTADLLSLGDIPFNSINIRPKRVEAIKYYQSLVTHFDIPVLTNSNVIDVQKNGQHFLIHYQEKASTDHLAAEYVILSTGFYNNPNRLNIPGEESAHVSHYYSEPYRYFGMKVVVVGGKNSAVEAALDLFRHGAEVTLVHRRSEIRDSVKYWILPDIENRIKEGSIKAHFNSQLKKIDSKSITIVTNGESSNIEADTVFLLTGYQPDITLLKRCGVTCDADSLEPDVNKSTLESNISGLYIAGSLLAGRNANRIFIENSRDHGPQIISALNKQINAVVDSK